MDESYRLFSYDKIFEQGQVRLPSADIFQIAEISLMQGGEIHAHTQYCDEITYVVSGKATLTSGNRTLVLSPKQIHYIKKGEKHILVADKDSNFHYFCIGFTPNADFHEFSGFYEYIKNLTDFIIFDENNIYYLFNSLISEFYQSQSHSDLMIHSIFSQIIISIERILTKSNTVNNKAATSDSGKAVYQTMKYIEKNYINLEKISDIGRELNYSEYYLSHAFKNKIGISLKSYLMQKKITMAVELLKNSNMSVSEISEHLHFSSLHSFELCFKKYIGSSPSELRKNIIK